MRRNQFFAAFPFRSNLFSLSLKNCSASVRKADGPLSDIGYAGAAKLSSGESFPAAKPAVGSQGGIRAALVERETAPPACAAKSQHPLALMRSSRAYWLLWLRTAGAPAESSPCPSGCHSQSSPRTCGTGSEAPFCSFHRTSVSSTLDDLRQSPRLR